MKSKKKKLLMFLSVLISFYLVFKTIFFVFFGQASVDIMIGFSILLLFFLIYKKGRLFIYGYLWSLTKNLYINFFSLFKLLVSFRKLVIGYNTVYLENFKYSFFSLKIISKSMSSIFSKLSLSLVNKFLVNLFLNKLTLKLFFVKNRTSSLPIEYSIRNNNELHTFIYFDVLFFVL